MDAFVELQACSIKLRSFCAHICTYIYTKGQEWAQKFALRYLKTPFCKKTSLVRQACRILIVFLFFKIKKLCLSVFDQKFMILNRYSYLESVGRAAPDLGKALNILSWVRPHLEKDPGLSR